MIFIWAKLHWNPWLFWVRAFGQYVFRARAMNYFNVGAWHPYYLLRSRAARLLSLCLSPSALLNQDRSLKQQKICLGTPGKRRSGPRSPATENMISKISWIVDFRLLHRLNEGERQSDERVTRSPASAFCEIENSQCPRGSEVTFS